MKTKPTKDDEGMKFNPERIDNPDLRCYQCKELIPLGDLCLEIQTTEKLINLCSYECEEKFVLAQEQYANFDAWKKYSSPTLKKKMGWE